MRFRVQDFGVHYGLGFRVLDFGVQNFWALGLGFKVWGLGVYGFGIWRFGFRVEDRYIAYGLNTRRVP